MFKWSQYKDQPYEFIITIGDYVEASDIKLFFDESFILGVNETSVSRRTVYRHYPSNTKFEDILVDLDFFESKGDCRRNNWNSEIQEGYSELKRKLSRFYFLKLTKPLT